MASATPTSKYQKMRLLQEAKAWDIEADLPWDRLDGAKPLLPDCAALAAELGLTDAEALALSQLLGLMAVQAISEHEKVLGTVKDACWEAPLARAAGGGKHDHELRRLGEQFFKEEAKHSRAFARYVATFAGKLGLDLADLRSVLPVYDPSSWTTALFRLNSWLGGRAIWWLVMITEEESTALFRQLRAGSGQVDPLFYELNRRHFEEEIRHMSYAPLMLRTLTEATPRKPWLRFDYLTAEALHIAWVIRQVLRLRRLPALAERHAFFASLSGVVRKLEARPARDRADILLRRVPYASQLLNPQRHKAVRVEVQRNRELAPGLIQRCLSWLGAQVRAP